MSPSRPGARPAKWPVSGKCAAASLRARAREIGTELTVSHIPRGALKPMDEPAPDASPGDRDAMEASERADDSIDRSYDAAEYEDEDPDADEDDEDEDEEDDDEESEEDEEEEEEEEEELTGRDRFQKRDSDSDTDSLPSVPDGSPLPSDYDSDAEPEPEPIDDGPPPYVIPEPLLHKKLVVVVHELKGLPKGYGTNVFCTVECGDVLYEATAPATLDDERTRCTFPIEEFAVRFHEDGAHEQTTITAVADKSVPLAPVVDVDGVPLEDEPSHTGHHHDAMDTETELGYFTFNALELVDGGDPDEAAANAKLASTDGDWVPLSPDPENPDPVLLNAQMEARVTIRVESGEYTSPESAARALDDATNALHVAAATALTPSAIKKAYANVTRAMDTLVAVAVYEARKVRAAAREKLASAGKKVLKGKALRDDEEDQDDKEEKAARKKRDPRKVVDGRVVLSGEEDGDAAAGGLTPLARASARPIGSRAGALVRAVLDLGADPSLRCGAFDQTPLHYAAACDAVDAAKALVVKSKKAHARARVMDDVDVTDREGFTPLHVAIVCGHLGTVKLLLGPGARASTTQRSGPGGYNAMHWAARAGDPAVLEAVRAHSAAGDLGELTQPPRVTSKGGGNVERKLSGDVGVRLDTDVVPGQTPLHVAARNGRIRALRLMLRNERDLDALDRFDGAGCTPLAAAAGVGKHETVRAMAEELGLDAADEREDETDADDAGGRRWDVEGAEGADDSSSNDDDDEAENGGVGDGRLEFSALEWAAYDGRAEVVKAVVRTGGHAPRDYVRAMRVAKTRRAKGPVLRLLSRGRE